MEKENKGQNKGIIIFVVIVIVAIIAIGIVAAFMNKPNNNDANKVEQNRENDMPTGTQGSQSNSIDSSSTPKE